MEVERRSSSVDIISELPSNIIEHIFMYLPLRDTVKTSILSRNWRFQWVQVPQLIFEEDLMMFSSHGGSNTDNLNLVFGILLQHRGPIRKFKLDMSCWCNCAGIEKIISFLAINGIQDLTILAKFDIDCCQKLPSSIFSCVELKRLSLQNCVFQPMTLKGFNALVTLELLDVKLGSSVSFSGCPFLQCLTVLISAGNITFNIDAPNLRSLFLDCFSCHICIKGAPFLKVLSLTQVLTLVYLEKKSKLTSFLSSVPLLENLRVTCFLNQRTSRNKLPTALNYLRILQLSYIDISVMGNLSFVIWLIRSSPNLQKIEFTKYRGPHHSQPMLNVQKLDYRDCCLMKLCEVKFELMTDLKFYLEFIKFLLAISPELETLYIKLKLASNQIQESDYKILLKLTCSPRASPKAKIIFQGLDLDDA